MFGRAILVCLFYRVEWLSRTFMNAFLFFINFVIYSANLLTLGMISMLVQISAF